MGIKGKWEIFFRLFGMILFLIGIISTVILDFYLLQDILVYIFLIIILVLLFSLIIGLKLELKTLMENQLMVSTIISMFSSIILIIGSIISHQQSIITIFLFLTLSNSLAIISWHFSLSLYKKKKFIFIIGSTIYVFISLFLRIQVLMKNFGLICLLPLIIIIIGIGTIITAEIILIKKKLLKYI